MLSTRDLRSEFPDFSNLPKANDGADPTLVQREIIVSFAHWHLKRLDPTEDLDFADPCAELRVCSNSTLWCNLHGVDRKHQSTKQCRAS
jgi:hypothetical protein